jgi:serine protease Do
MAHTSSSTLPERAAAAVRSRPAVFGFGALFLGVALTCTPQWPADADEATPVASLPFLAPAPVHAGASDNGSLNLISDTAEAVLPAVVNISTARIQTMEQGMGPFFSDPFFKKFFGEQAPDSEPQRKRMSAMGSGVLVRADGVILTNNHVVDGADEVKVTLSDGREFSATVKGKDKRADLAVIQLDGDFDDLPILPLGDAESLRLGEVVLAVGNPFGLDGTVTMGIVSATGRSGVGIVDYEDFIQTDAAINPGNSGGALVNLQGELVGINTAIASRSGGYQGIGFAIPTTMVQPIMESLLATGRVERGWLGVRIQDLDAGMAESFGLDAGERGVLVAEVMKGSPASAAKLLSGDVILTLDGVAMTSTHELRNRVSLQPAGKVVKLDLWRGGKAKAAKVTLGVLPEEGVSAAEPEESEASEVLVGLELAPLDADMRSRFSVADDVKKGLIVVRVQPGSDAAEAGIQPGDVILEVNRRRVSDLRTFKDAQGEADRALVLLSRQGRSHYLMLG